MAVASDRGSSRLRFNRDWKWRDDGDRITFYQPHGGPVRVLSPLSAAVVTALDGGNGLGRLSHALAVATGHPADRAAKAVMALLQRNRQFIVPPGDVAQETERDGPPGARGEEPADPALVACFRKAHNRGGGPLPADGRLKAPIWLTWMATLACPARCVHCGIPRPDEVELGPDLTLAELRLIWADAARTGVKVVRVHGGEPLLRPDLFDCLEAVVDCGLTFTISSRRLIDPATARRLADLRPLAVQVSLETVDDRLAEFIAGRPDVVPSALVSLGNLWQAGVRPRVNVVVTRHNADQVSALVRLIARGGPCDIGLADYEPSLWGEGDSLFPSREQAERLERSLDELAAGLPPDTRLERPWLMSRREKSISQAPHYLGCSAGRRALAVWPDGRTGVCDNLTGVPEAACGDLRRHTLAEIWDSPEMMQKVDPPRELFVGTVCHDCPAFEACNRRERCWKESMRRNRGRFYAPDYLCREAGEPGE